MGGTNQTQGVPVQEGQGQTQEGMDREKAITLLRLVANKLASLAVAKNKDDAWKEEWRKNVELFKEVLKMVEGTWEENVFIIDHYRHRTIDFGNGNFAINITIAGEPKWLFINPRVHGHQWFYDSLEDMLNSIYIYSRVYVFADDMFVVDDYGNAKWLKPLWYEPMEIKPIVVPPNVSEQEKQLIEKVNKLIEMNNRFLCMPPFTVVSGCYELAMDIDRSAKGLIVVRPPFNGSPMAITDEEKIYRIVEESFRQAYPYDLCGDAYCDETYVVDDLRGLLIFISRYPANHRDSNIEVRLFSFKIIPQLMDNSER